MASGSGSGLYRDFCLVYNYHQETWEGDSKMFYHDQLERGFLSIHKLSCSFTLSLIFPVPAFL